MKDKKIGDWVFLYDDEFHQIKNSPGVFKSNRLATEEEIKKYNARTTL